MSSVNYLNPESQLQPNLPAFLEKLGIVESNYQKQFLAQDCSTRWYERLIFTKPLILKTKSHEIKQAVLMHIPVEEQKIGQKFLSISKRLAGIHLRVPETYAYDFEKGLFLLEDFGDKTYQRLLRQGHQSLPLYKRAVDVLIHLHRLEAPSSKKTDLALFDLPALLEEVSLWADWYYPFLCMKHLSSQEKSSFLSLWRDVLSPLEETFTSDRISLVLKDYHVDNLMDCSGEGLHQCGLLDFQDALYGPTAYDLVSLLEDARLDVDPELAKVCKQYYLSAQPASFDREAFEHEYLLLGAQRATKILGIFARLSLRDQKSQHLHHLPRVLRYLETALAHTLFDELRYSFDQLVPRSMRSLF
ncbi:MAG: aminoglycoside phosphotransferase family protein [Alphaproteobacteria bacterium]